MCVKFSQVCGVISFQLASLAPAVFAQQSVHLTLGILRKSQAVFYALSFFWLDGFAIPAPAQVTQTVGRLAVVKLPQSYRMCVSKGVFFDLHY